MTRRTTSAARVRNFIEDTFLYMHPDVELADDEPLLDPGPDRLAGVRRARRGGPGALRDPGAGHRDHRGEFRLDRRRRRVRRPEAARDLSGRTFAEDLSARATEDPDRIALVTPERRGVVARSSIVASTALAARPRAPSGSPGATGRDRPPQRRRGRGRDLRRDARRRSVLAGEPVDEARPARPPARRPRGARP